MPRLREWTVVRLLAHLGDARWLYVIALVFMLLDAACQTAVPLFFRHILNGLQEDPAGFMHRSFTPALIAAGALALVFVPCAYFGHVLATVSSARLVHNLRTRLYVHVQRLSADFHQQRQVGETAARINGDLEQASVALGVGIGMVWAGFTVIYALAMMLWIDPPLSALFLALFAAGAWATARFMPVVRRMSRQVQDRAGQTGAVVTELLSVQPLLKSFTREEDANARVRAQAGALCRAREHLAWRRFLYNDAMQLFLKFLAPFALLFVGGWMVAEQRMRIGDLVAFWGYWMLLTHAMTMIFNSIANVFIGMAAADRVFEYLDTVPSIADAPDAHPLPPVRGAIAFEDVWFTYPQIAADASDGPVLRGLDLQVAPGTTVALVGPSGAGKSTILQLLLRFYDPDTGCISIDGHDLRCLQQTSLRAHIGVVFQENHFLAGTVADNLRIARPDADDAAIRQALVDANAWNFVAAMSEGVDTLLGERGTRLSGGQKQRLAIARVFLKDPAIMLLDEATSALDASSEALVIEAMRRLLHGRTAIVVAHRIATIRDADRIVIIDGGRAVAAGKHHELREHNALYAAFCERQRVA
ncbi:MAG: ABC transporter ATP-binding protein [Planctomycetota bacterium]